MKKHGFTLAEFLIAIGIIGVVAAITGPMLTSMMPDKKKMMTIKYTKVVSEINAALLNDPSYYPGNFTNYTPVCTEYIDLSCTDPTFENVNGSKPSGDTKYPELLQSQLQVTKRTNANNFTTVDGATWTVSKPDQNKNYTITITPKNIKDSITLNVKKNGMVEGLGNPMSIK